MSALHGARKGRGPEEPRTGMSAPPNEKKIAGGDPFDTLRVNSTPPLPKQFCAEGRGDALGAETEFLFREFESGA